MPSRRLQQDPLGWALVGEGSQIHKKPVKTGQEERISLMQQFTSRIPKLELPQDKIAEFCQRWQVIEFALFGSVLRHDFGPNSDVDVIVQFHPNAHPTLFDLTYMEEELKAIFHRDVDLVTRKGIESSRNYLRRNAILSSAQVVYGTGSTVSA